MMKQGGVLEKALRRKQPKGMCATCGNLIKASDNGKLLGCTAHDKFIMADYLPYHSEHRLCGDWTVK